MTAQEVIKKFMSGLDNSELSGESALDEAIQACSDFSSIQDVIDQMISDCKSVNNSDTFLKNYCGIILNNTDTGAITGKDAGGDTVKTAETVIEEDGSLQIYTNNSFTTNGLTFQLTSLDTSSDYEGHYSDLDYNSLTSNQKFIWNALYTWWAEKSLDLIVDSYGSNYGFDENSSATVKNIHVGFVTESNTTLASVVNWSDNKTTGDLDLRINMKYYSNIDTSNYNGYSSTADYYLDRTLAHELTHASMAANVYYFNSLPLFIKEGIAELTHGIDDTRKTRISNLAGNSDSLASALDISSTVSSANQYAGGYMFMRYLAKQFSDPTLTVYNGVAGYNNISVTGLTDSADTDDLNIFGSNITLNADIISDNGATVSGEGFSFKLSDSAVIYNLNSSSTLKGSSNSDSLIGSSYADTIYGYSGNDSIVGGYGNDYLSGSYGNDTIIGGYGKDYIIGGNGADYLSGGYGNDTIYGYSGNDRLFGNAGADYLYGGSGKDSIYGYAGNDYLVGGGGADYLYGGSGNDTLTGGKGSDIFVYKKSTGNDVISDYTSSDKITISGSYTSSISDSDVIFKVGTGTLTVKDGVDKKITVNNKVKTYSANIDEILDDDLVGEIDFAENIKNIDVIIVNSKES